MNDQDFIHQLGIDLSLFNSNALWFKEAVFVNGHIGTAFYSSEKYRLSGHVVLLGRRLVIADRLQKSGIEAYLRAKGYEVAEAFDNGTRVK